jgi:hypothetical protein
MKIKYTDKFGTTLNATKCSWQKSKLYAHVFLRSHVEDGREMKHTNEDLRMNFDVYFMEAEEEICEYLFYIKIN